MPDSVGRYEHNPMLYEFPNGVQIKLYTIGYVAQLIGRRPSCVRRWEVSGVIPATMFKNGRYRMYSEEQVDVLVNAAFKSRISSGRSMSETQFPAQVRKGFAALQEKYMKYLEG